MDEGQASSQSDPLGDRSIEGTEDISVVLARARPAHRWLARLMPGSRDAPFSVQT